MAVVLLLGGMCLLALPGAARRLGRLAPDVLIRKAPLVSGWGEGRDIPLPAARSFRQRFAARKEEGW